MKKLVQLIVLIITINASAQQYKFSIVSDYNNIGNAYEFTLIATPDFTNADPNMADIQFTIAISSGNSIQTNSFTELLGSNWQVNTALSGSILQTNFGIGDGSKDLWLFTLPVPTSALTTAHTSGTGIPLVSFIVDNGPTSGMIEILENSDSIAIGLSGIGFVVDNTINVDLGMGSGTQNYYGSLDSENMSFMFGTLSTPEVERDISLSLYPNPAKDYVTIKGTVNSLNTIEIYNINGQRIIEIRNPNERTIDVSKLESALYLVRLSTNSGKAKTLKFIKE